MRKLSFRVSENAPIARGGVVTIGNFDGVHRGHQAVLARARAAAGDKPVVVVTFDPHPLAIVRPDREHIVLTGLTERERLLRRYGADQVVTLETTGEMLGLEAREFFDWLWDRFAPTVMVEGADFRFGRGRSGTTEQLADWLHDKGSRLVIVAPVCDGEEVISSTGLRQAREANNHRRVRHWLGRAQIDF